MTEENVFSDEGGLSEAVSRAVYLAKQNDVVSFVTRSRFFNDEPKFYSFTSGYYCQGVNRKKELDLASGISLNRDEAFVKSVSEAVERHCLSFPKKSIWRSYNQLRNKALNIFELIAFSQAQLKDGGFSNFRFNEESKFRWETAFDLINFRKIFVPSQLLYVPYGFNNEKVIRNPISTGAASGLSLGGAIYRGICEVIERDAFMITYLNCLTREGVDLRKSGPELKNLHDIYNQYNLELNVIDITTDIAVPTMMGVLFDRTGQGPAISIGLATDLNPLCAAIKAAVEAQHIRPWIRREMYLGNKGGNLNYPENRGLFWSKLEMISRVQFLVDGKRKGLSPLPTSNVFKGWSLKKLLDKLKLCGLNVYFSALTTDKIKKYGYRVVKVIIPGLHPLYLREDHPYWGGKRVFDAPVKMGLLKRKRKSLNRLPHPFL